MEKSRLESMHYCYLTTKNIWGLKMNIKRKWTFKFVNSFVFGPPYRALTLDTFIFDPSNDNNLCNIDFCF